MRLNPKNRHGKHITNIHGEREVVKEERPAAFSDTTDSDVESGDVADVIIVPVNSKGESDNQSLVSENANLFKDDLFAVALTREPSSDVRIE